MGFVLHSPEPAIEGSIYFSSSGNCGWSGMPFAFEVFSQLLRAVIGYLMVGLLPMYCARFMGFVFMLNTGALIVRW